MGSLTAWNTSVARAHMTGSVEPDTKRDKGWPAFWKAMEILTVTGLVEVVGHVIDSDTLEGAVLHPYAVSNGELGEQAVAGAAHAAGLAMLNDTKRMDALSRHLWLLPAKKHLTGVQIVGLLRLRYRARTKATAQWLSSSADWDGWVQGYKTVQAEVAAATSGLSTSTYGINADIKVKSMRYQR